MAIIKTNWRRYFSYSNVTKEILEDKKATVLNRISNKAFELAAKTKSNDFISTFRSSIGEKRQTLVSLLKPQKRCEETHSSIWQNIVFQLISTKDDA